jgi:hypothetical protein
LFALDLLITKSAKNRQIGETFVCKHAP